MESITKPQLQKLHVLFTQLKLIDDKPGIVHQFTKGRTTSSKEMTLQEATELIRSLSLNDPSNRMRKKIFALARNCGIIYGETWQDKKMNIAKLNAFIKEKGTIKKALNSMTPGELVKTVNQFQMMFEHKGQTQANKATRSLLEELSIPVVHPSKARH